MIVAEITRYEVRPSGEVREKHLEFLRARGAEGKVLIAGRFADAKGGMLLWKVDSMEEAKKIAEDDPYVRNAVLQYELREWSAAFDYTANPPKVG